MNPIKFFFYAAETRHASIDGVKATVPDSVEIDPGIEFVRWEKGAGHIDYLDGREVKQIKVGDPMTEFQELFLNIGSWSEAERSAIDTANEASMNETYNRQLAEEQAAYYALSYDELKELTLEKIANAAHQQMWPLLRRYPESERLSFAQQEQEARMIVANPATADSPLIDEIAALRGVSREEMAVKINKRAVAYRRLLSRVLARKQELSNQADAAANKAALEAIDITFTVNT